MSATVLLGLVVYESLIGEISQERRAWSRARPWTPQRAGCRWSLQRCSWCHSHSWARCSRAAARWRHAPAPGDCWGSSHLYAALHSAAQQKQCPCCQDCSYVLAGVSALRFIQSFDTRMFTRSQFITPLQCTAHTIDTYIYAALSRQTRAYKEQQPVTIHDIVHLHFTLQSFRAIKRNSWQL